MTPAKPRPLLVPMTSTCLTSLNTSAAVKMAPTLRFGWGRSRRNSRMNFCGSQLAFSRDRHAGRLISCRRLETNPPPHGHARPGWPCGAACSRSRFARRRSRRAPGCATCRTGHGPTDRIVTGASLPFSSKTCVMPTLRPSNPIVMGIAPLCWVAFPKERGHAAARRQRTSAEEGLIMVQRLNLSRALPCATKFIAGNWKMFTNAASAGELADGCCQGAWARDRGAGRGLPAVSLPGPVGPGPCGAARSSSAAQNLIPKRKGPSPARSARPCCSTSAAST